MPRSASHLKATSEPMMPWEISKEYYFDISPAREARWTCNQRTPLAALSTRYDDFRCKC
jgi:hypothetical protein